MKRRTAAVLVAAMAWGLSTTALAQTTSTSTSTSSSTTSTSTSTSTTSTSTTVVNPCTGQPCTVDPPVATLSGSAGDVRLLSGGSCWRAPTPTADRGLVTACIAVTMAPEADIPVGMVVRRGETLSLRFGISMSPTEVRLTARGEQRTLTPANPTVFVADLPVGVYLISFSTKWNQGDAGYFLKVDVRAPGPTVSDPRPLALTG